MPCELTAWCPPVCWHSLVCPLEHSSVPTRTMVRLARAAAVKEEGRPHPAAAPAGLVLDGREHGGRLMCVGNDSGWLLAAFVVDR
jgi:hypothetical protein